MKQFIFLEILICGTMASLPEKIQHLLDSVHAKCVSKIGVSEDIFVGIKSGDFVPDPKLKCYLHCCLNELGLITDDGKVDVEKSIASLPDFMKDYATPVFVKCGSQAGTDVCDVVFNTLKCYYEMDKRAFVLP
uniref:General odorant-binding protein 83a-like isoform X1 n=1 Tax=Diabrotica virgifera virgifera TaxID=50390 RepID=A0A6P7FHM6_DIAVI